MPNWCSADVEIFSDSIETLEAIITQGAKGTYTSKSEWSAESSKFEPLEFDDNKFSFENFFPTPPELLEGDGWHTWRVDNWGTKWDIAQEECQVAEPAEVYDPSSRYKYSFKLGFQTAWSPALGVFQKIAQDFDVQVEYRYIEEGCAYFGVCVMDKDTTEDDERVPTTEDYRIAGCVIGADGEVDWDSTDEYDLFLALDYWKEYEPETSNSEV